MLYLHYPDPAVPVPESVGALAEAARVGKVAHLGLSTVSADQVRAGHRELGIALVPWSPLGGGFLTGTVATRTESDLRQHNPRYAGGALRANRDRFAPLMNLAAELLITPAQLALEWLLHPGPDVIPIPGSRRPEGVDENAAAAGVSPSTAVLARIEELAPPDLAVGATVLP